jgi:hypothetical protein
VVKGDNPTLRETAKYKSRAAELEAGIEAVSAKVDMATAALVESNIERKRLSAERGLLERAARDMSALNAKLTQKLVVGLCTLNSFYPYPITYSLSNP